MLSDSFCLTVFTSLFFHFAEAARAKRRDSFLVGSYGLKGCQGTVSERKCLLWRSLSPFIVMGCGDTAVSVTPLSVVFYINDVIMSDGKVSLTFLPITGAAL